MKFKTKLIAAIKIWVVIYPSITIFNYFLGEYLISLPLYIRTGILTLCLVPWVVFVGLPFLNFMLSLFSPKKE